MLKLTAMSTAGIVLLAGLSALADPPAGTTASPISKFERDCGFLESFVTSDGKRWLRDFRGSQWLSDDFHGPAKAVADAAARSRRDGKSYSPG